MNKLSIGEWSSKPATCLPFPAFQPRNTQKNIPPVPTFYPLTKNRYGLMLAFTLTVLLPSVAPAQCFVLQYPNLRRVLKVDGDFVQEYASLKRIYKFDGDYLLSYSNYKRLLKFDGRYIVRYSDFKRIAILDGEYLVRYSDYRRIARLECPGRRSALAAAAYFLL
jgi:hypothetical protein